MTQTLVSSVTGDPSFTILNCLDLTIWSLLKHTPPFSSHRSTTSPLSNPFHFSLLRSPMLSFHVRLLFAFQPVCLSFCVFQQDHMYKHSPVSIMQTKWPENACKKGIMEMCKFDGEKSDMQLWLKRHYFKCMCKFNIVITWMAMSNQIYWVKWTITMKKWHLAITCIYRDIAHMINQISTHCLTELICIFSLRENTNQPWNIHQSIHAQPHKARLVLTG